MMAFSTFLSLVTASWLVPPQQPGRTPPRWQSPPAGRAAVACVRMGVSDRMATDGMLYDGWGAEGMRVLNKTTEFQTTVADATELSHYDAVLMIAARAKQNAYEHAEVRCARIRLATRAELQSLCASVPLPLSHDRLVSCAGGRRRVHRQLLWRQHGRGHAQEEARPVGGGHRD